MPPIELTPAERKEKRGEAHHLDPVVMIGAEGLTAAVLAEAEAAIKAHGLIKVRAFSDDRATREAWLRELSERLDAAPVQHIGKLLVLWRPVIAAASASASAEDRGAGPRTVKILKFSKRPGQRPEMKRVKVMGNQRVTAGGQVKRAKKRPVSIKKTTA
jgi:putative YhbY family RNA-binding protein